MGSKWHHLRQLEVGYLRELMRCCYPDCVVVPRAGHLMCKPHWFSLPTQLRMKIQIAWDNGGEGSSMYRKAIAELSRHLRGDKRGRTEAPKP